MKKENLPGWVAMAALAWFAMLVSDLAGRPLMTALSARKNPIETMVVAIIIGVALRNLKLIPKFFDAGIKAYEKPLTWGIVLYGAGLNFTKLANQAPKIFITVITTMAIGFFAIYFIGRAFKLPEKLSMLLGVGTTICGGSAIAITAPLIEAEERDTSYAVTTIALWGLLAIIVYPLAAAGITGVTDAGFGVFAGTAIHATPQVIAAGFIYSEAAGRMATAVKLVRNCFMVPLGMAIAIWYTRKRSVYSAREGKKLNWIKAFPWFLFGYFLMAILGTKGFFTEAGIASFETWGKFLLLMGMAGIGMNTQLDSFRGTGIKALIVGLIGSITVAMVSLGLIWWLELSAMPAV